jgi:two-component system nitrate/nitrite response regulator NarL
MPGGGVNVINEILSRSPATRIIMLTADEELETLAAAVHKGAVGYILKGVGSRSLADAIRKIAEGARVVSPIMSVKLAERILNRQNPVANELTPRETEVMNLVAEGLSNKHIGLRLDLQEKTVKHHMTQILMKVGAANRTEAAIKWRATR